MPRVLYVPFQLKYKDEEDKANGLTSPPNDLGLMVWPGFELTTSRSVDEFILIHLEGAFIRGGSYSDIYIFCLQVDGPTTGAGVLYGAYIFIFDLIFPLLSFPFHLHLVEFYCVGRSC